MNISALKPLLPADIFAELTDILKVRVVSKTQLCHLLSNCAHETQGWTKFEENLNYSAKRLLEVFGKRIGTIEKAKSIVSKGVVAIADAIYGGRMGNKKGTADAYNMRGSGCLQLTGHDNFVLFDATVPESIIDNPNLVRTKYKLTSAFWFFDVNKLWVLARIVDNVKAIRLRVNGGTNGLTQVQSYFNKYFKLISE